MAYFCKDCSYRGKKSGQAGECPACGSFNLAKRRDIGREEAPPPRWRVVLVLLLWGILGTLVLSKIIK